MADSIRRENVAGAGQALVASALLFPIVDDIA